MKGKNQYLVALDNLAEQQEFIQKLLLYFKATQLETSNALVLIEEIVVRLHENGFQSVTVRIRRFLGEVTLVLSYNGEAYNPFDTLELFDNESEDYLRDMIFRAFKDDLNYIHHNKRNTITICAHHSDNRALFVTFSAMVLGIVCGFCMKLIPPTVANMIADGIFDSVQTVFMNALSLLLAPIVFFSVSVSLVRIGGGNTGRISIKTIAFFALCSAIALCIATGLSSLIFSKINLYLDNSYQTLLFESKNSEHSLKTFILDIVPKNLVVPIMSGNVLQVLFFAFLLGGAMGVLGEKVSGLLGLFEEAKVLFNRTLATVTSFMPLIAASAMASLVYKSSAQVLLMLIWYMAVVIIGCILLFFVFSLIVAIVLHCNPFLFIKKMSKFFLTPFLLPKQSAIVPLTLQFCTEQFGVSEKIAAFVLSFGASINKCAVAFCVMVEVIFFAHISGIQLDSFAMLKIAIMTFMLSIGSNGLVCLMAVLPVAGISVNLISLTLGVDDIIDRIRTVTNVSADITASIVVSKSEKNK